MPAEFLLLSGARLPIARVAKFPLGEVLVSQFGTVTVTPCFGRAQPNPEKVTSSSSSRTVPLLLQSSPTLRLHPSFFVFTSRRPFCPYHCYFLLPSTNSCAYLYISGTIVDIFSGQSAFLISVASCFWTFRYASSLVRALPELLVLAPSRLPIDCHHGVS